MLGSVRVLVSKLRGVELLLLKIEGERRGWGQEDWEGELLQLSTGGNTLDHELGENNL